MPRVLFISTSLPPTADSQTIRNVFLINGLLSRGHNVHLIQPPATAGDPELESLVRGGIERTFTELPKYDMLLGFLRSHLSNPGIRVFLHRTIAKLAGLTCAPDVRTDWSGKAYLAAVDTSASRLPDIIISSSGSNTAHMAAARLARQWKRPWIAEFGDPWSLNPIRPASHTHMKFMNRKLERQTLSAAAGIVFTTVETRDAFVRQNLGRYGIPTAVVPCGYDPSLPGVPRDDGPGYPRAGTTQELVLTYTGTAERGSRDLSPIIDSFQEALAADPSLPRVRIRLVGSIHRSIGGALAPDGRLKVDHVGWVSYPDSIRELSRADALILIGNRSNLQVPAKVYNYLASGKPIFYFSQQPADSDPTWNLLRSHERCMAVSDKSTETLKTTGAFLHRVMQCSSDPDGMGDILSWDEVGEEFSQFVESVTSGAGSRRSVPS